MPYRRAYTTLISAVALAAPINFASAQFGPSTAEEKQRAIEEQLAEAAKPTTMLLEAYRNYLAARQCFDSRAGFAVVYVTPQQMEEAKEQVKSIEAALLQFSRGSPIKALR